jgi:hypothetical protein
LFLLHSARKTKLGVAITLEPVEKAIADGVFCSRILKDRDQSSFLGISLAVCFFGRVSPL